MVMPKPTENPSMFLFLYWEAEDNTRYLRAALGHSLNFPVRDEDLLIPVYLVPSSEVDRLGNCIKDLGCWNFVKYIEYMRRMMVGGP